MMTRLPRPLPRRPRLPLRLTASLLAIGLVAACDGPLDFDLRGKLGSGFDTSDAALKATAKRPQPDARGIISYPNYQVAVARRGDTLRSLAERIGADPAALARYNGMQPDDKLRRGEVIALRKRVEEPESGPIRPAAPEPADITDIAGAAIDRAEAPAVNTSQLPAATPAAAPAPAPAAQTGAEPVRHKVERGETAYTIARLYNVSVRSLADWNGLDRDFSIREGQFLLIPVALSDARPVRRAEPTAPGEGSPTPVPPSAAKPLPAESPKPAADPAPVATPPAPKLTQTPASTASRAAMSMPLDGKIIREYAKGRTDGIDISAAPGTPVTAAASGRVGAITSDAGGKNIVVVKHPDGLLTVYANVGRIAVKKGDSVSRGQKIAEVGAGDPSSIRFGVYKGSDSVDPAPYLN